VEKIFFSPPQVALRKFSSGKNSPFVEKKGGTPKKGAPSFLKGKKFSLRRGRIFLIRGV